MASGEVMNSDSRHVRRLEVAARWLAACPGAALTADAGLAQPQTGEAGGGDRCWRGDAKDLGDEDRRQRLALPGDADDADLR